MRDPHVSSMSHGDQVVWITGASSGIGEALAKQLAAQGTTLILSARRSGELERVRVACGRDASTALVLPFDAADPAAVQAAATEALTWRGRIDVLVNNAGMTQRSLAKDTDLAVYRQLLEVNFFAAVALTRRVLPGMLERRAGHLVYTSSVVGKYGAPLRTGYAAAKHAAQGFFESLRAEVWRENVAVTIVVAGPVRTPISLHALTGDGSPHGKMDPLQDAGQDVDAAARAILAGVARRQPEVVVGRGRPLLALTLRRFVPAIFHRVIRSAKPT
jgi:short-subunit dehydrogenase